MSQPTLLARQSSFFHAFRYDYLAPSGEVLGGFSFATFAQANNSRLKVHKEGSTAGQIQVDFCGKKYGIQHEFSNRRTFVVDTRYIMVGDAQPLATFDFRFREGERWPELSLRFDDQEVAFKIAGHVFSRRFEMHDPETHTAMGEVRDAPGISIKRTIMIQGPRVPDHAKALLGVVFAIFRP